MHDQFFGGAQILNVCDKKVRQQQIMEVFYLQYLGDMVDTQNYILFLSV